MLVRLTEAIENRDNKSFNLKEVSINPAHVVAVRSEEGARRALSEGRMPTGLSEATEFSRVYLNTGQYGMNILVVGNPELIEEKIKKTKSVLKG
jgi:hypothetical protein